MCFFYFVWVFAFARERAPMHARTRGAPTPDAPRRDGGRRPPGRPMPTDVSAPSAERAREAAKPSNQ